MSDTKDKPRSNKHLLCCATVAEVERLRDELSAARQVLERNGLVTVSPAVGEVERLKDELAAANHRALMAQLDDSLRDELQETRRFMEDLEAWDSAVKAACGGAGGLSDHLLARLAAILPRRNARRSP